MGANDMTPFNWSGQANIARVLYGRGGYGLCRAYPRVPGPLRASHANGLRFATNFSVDVHITTQTGRIVKHFQEIRCSRKSLSGNGLRDILHVVSRKIAEFNLVNRGVWPFRILRARGGVNTAQYVIYDTLFVVFKMQSVDLMPR